MKGLDLRKFEKISDDKKSAKLRHPDGHEITIAKGSLSPSLRSQLEGLRMANGGEAEPHKERDRQMIAKADELSKKHNLNVKEDRPVPRGTSGNVIATTSSQYAEGGQADHKDQSILALSKALSRMGGGGEKGVHQPSKADPKGGTSVAGEWNQFGDQSQPNSWGNQEAKSLHKQKLKELQGMKKPVLMAEAGDPADAPQNQGVQDVDWSQQPQQQGPAPASVPNQQQSPVDQNQPSPSPQSQMMPTGQNFQAGLPMPAPNPQDLQKNNMNEYQLFSNDVYNGHVSPKTIGDLYNDKGTLGKIGMIFGAALGGAGGGLTHSPNAFLGVIDQQLNRDLQAQIKSKDNAQNYVKLSQAQILAESQGKLTNQQAGQLAIANGLARANIGVTKSLTDKYNALPDGSPLKAKYGHQLALLYNHMDEKNSSLAAQAAGLEATMLGYKGAYGAGSSPSGVPMASNSSSPQTGQQTGGATGDFGTGAPPSGQDQQAQQPIPEVGGSSSMLMPNAAVAMDNIQSDRSISPEQKSIMTKEYQAQVNAQAGMKAIDQIFPRLSDEATPGQWLADEGSAAAHNLGQIGSGIAGAGAALGAGKLIGLGGAAAGAGEAAAGAGAAAGAAGTAGAAAIALPVAVLATLGAGAYMYMTKNQRAKYDSDRVALRSALSTALKGVPGYDNNDAIKALVDANTPTVFDSDESMATKAKNIKDIIRLHTKSTFLKDRGLSNN